MEEEVIVCISPSETSDPIVVTRGGMQTQITDKNTTVDRQCLLVYHLSRYSSVRLERTPDKRKVISSNLIASTMKLRRRERICHAEIHRNR